MIDNCGNCVFWRKTNLYDVGECRRHAPESGDEKRYQSSDLLPRWPITNSREWCGDYESASRPVGERVAPSEETRSGVNVSGVPQGGADT